MQHRKLSVKIKNRISGVNTGSQVRNWLMRIKDKAMC